MFPRCMWGSFRGAGVAVFLWCGNGKGLYEVLQNILRYTSVCRVRFQ